MDENKQPEEVLDDTPVTQANEPAKEPTVEAKESATDSTTKENKKPGLEVKPQNVTIKYPVFIQAEWDPEKGAIYLPTATREQIEKKIEDAPNIDLQDSAKSKEWGEAVTEGLKLIPMSNLYQGSLDRPDAHWAQEVESNGKYLKAAAPALSTLTGELSGERGLLRFLKFNNMSDPFSVPLWHTGIWVTFKAPSEARLLELQREMISDKIILGRFTYGLALSSMVSANTERLLNLCMEHVYQTNLKSDQHLYDTVSCHDIPTLIWGMAATIWNNGYQYERACTHDPEKCQHVDKGRLNLQLMQYVNESAYSPWCRSLMEKRKVAEVTMDDVKRFKSEVLQMQNRRVAIKSSSGAESYVDLRVPTIREYLQRSQDWINSITKAVEKSLDYNPTDEDRNRYVLQNAQSSALRQWSHWVDSIHFGESWISDQETINQALEFISSEDQVSKDKLDESIRTYINDSCNVVLGIPSYICPNCKGEQKYDAAKAAPNIIPIDIIQTFFSLLVRKLQPVTSL